MHISSPLVLEDEAGKANIEKSFNHVTCPVTHPEATRPQSRAPPTSPSQKERKKIATCMYVHEANVVVVAAVTTSWSFHVHPAQLGVGMHTDRLKMKLLMRAREFSSPRSWGASHSVRRSWEVRLASEGPGSRSHRSHASLFPPFFVL